MTYGERSALEGLVAAAKPAIAIEVGMARDGEPRLASPPTPARCIPSTSSLEPEGDLPPNVTAHTGNSRETLPRVLSAELAEEGRRVEFCLIDGDHTAAGVTADLDAVLRSPAVDFALVVLHDTMNGEVRRGIRSVGLEAIPRVVYCDLDLVPGYAAAGGPYAGQLWGGLGLVVVDPGAASPGARGSSRTSTPTRTRSALRLGSPRALAARARQGVVDRVQVAPGVARTTRIAR